MVDVLLSWWVLSVLHTMGGRSSELVLLQDAVAGDTSLERQQKQTMAGRELTDHWRQAHRPSATDPALPSWARQGKTGASYWSGRLSMRALRVSVDRVNTTHLLYIYLFKKHRPHGNVKHLVHWTFRNGGVFSYRYPEKFHQFYSLYVLATYGMLFIYVRKSFRASWNYGLLRPPPSPYLIMTSTCNPNPCDGLLSGQENVSASLESSERFERLLFF